MTLSLDAQAILLLCSPLGLSSNPEFPPLTLRDWNSLARRLQSAALRPAALLECSPAAIKDQCGLNDEESERISRLLQRSGSLAIALERLASLGIRVMTRADADYPSRFRQRLKESAPPVLFYAGEKTPLGQPGVAVVGSRRLDATGQACAGFVGDACGLSGLVLYSGGAKGVDTLSMNAALAAGGTAVGILAESLEKAIRDPGDRAAISRGNLCMATPYSPDAPFSVGSAMGRNKLIYSLADYAIVVASDFEKGGTWTGATEALKSGWIPIFVLDHPAMPVGNRMLLKKGAHSFPYPFPDDRLKLKEWLAAQAGQADPVPVQHGLF